MFSKAIVRIPCENMINGITKSEFGIPDYKIAINQHKKYIEVLQKCGMEVTVLAADEKFPDSVFIEDTAVLTSVVAIICNPGALSRNKEIAGIEPSIAKYFYNIEKIIFPGTVDGGDVMMVNNHFYLGISERTNNEGANQFINILEKYDLTGSKVSLKEVLHLKTGVNYLDKNTLLVCGEFIDKVVFNSFHKIIIPKDEAYAANSLWINNTVLVPEGFPGSLNLIKEAGYKTIEVDVSEFKKLDGGLSCLSLRF